MPGSDDLHSPGPQRACTCRLEHPNPIACLPARWYKAALKPSPQSFPECGQSVLLLSQVSEPAFSLLSLIQLQPWAKAFVFHTSATLFTL